MISQIEIQKSEMPLKTVNGLARKSELTAPKQAFDYNRCLIEANHEPLITVNRHGKILDMNEAWIIITGLSRDKLANTSFSGYFTEPKKAEEISDEIMAKGSVSAMPLKLVHRDGRIVEVLFSGSVYKDEGGNAGIVVVITDMTSQKVFENELIKAKNTAEEAAKKAGESSQLKESFLANMSHEIRTPLNAIVGFSDILSRKKLGKKEQEHVNTIKTAGENLLTIINDILDISKIEAGMMSFEEKTFTVKEIFQSVKDMLIQKANEKKLKLQFNIAPSVPHILLGDPIRLTQILINLAGNAIKFTSEGKVVVTCKLLKNEEEKSFVEFSVKDTGIGIPEDKLHFVFERFRQAESHTTRKYGGSGLGLSIAKQLVELQGGELSVKSKFKIGSTFSFYIPYKTSTEIQAAPQPPERKYDLKKLSKLKILLVEDNRLNVLLVTSLFAENKLKLQVAENGNVCLEMMKENRFDIILMDMEMPVMNGYEAATIIRKDFNSNIPIIAMTAHAMAGEREKCLSLGMNDYISKPINANMLFEKMSELTINDQEA